MANEPFFRESEPDLRSILDQLGAHEPIFHTASFGANPADWDKTMAPDYGEVGASGRRYSRAFIMETLSRHPPADEATLGWEASGFTIRRLGAETYLLTYTLRHRERLTRRATIWQWHGEGWQILYHQGAVVVSGEDDAMPVIPQSGS